MAGTRKLAPLLLALAACSEPAGTKVTPTDRFAVPAAVAVQARASGGHALLVASGNYDLRYEGATGGTLLSVNPALAPEGSAAAGGGALVKYGEGAHVGSFAGQLVLADAASCPVPAGDPAPPPEALLVTRFADQLWRLPVGPDGQVDPCEGSRCVVKTDARLKDPFSLALACRPDGGRRTAFMGYLRVAQLDSLGATGWLTEVDLDDPDSPTRSFTFGTSPLAGMAYDGEQDRLYVLSQPLLAAPVFIVDLFPCPDTMVDGTPTPTPLASCPPPTATFVDLDSAQRGLELQDIALSNPQAGLGRRAYVSARVYDPVVASLLLARPAADVTGVLLVLDLAPGLSGRPSLQVLRMVETGLGASQVRVLPVRDAGGGPPRRDVVVVSSITDGMVTVYDDEAGEVVRVLPVDEATGAPEAGRGPFGMAVVRQPGATPAEDVARVYVAASQTQQVGIIDVPLATPGQAHALRDGATGALVRIGGLQ
jgi:hypothetical protein